MSYLAARKPALATPSNATATKRIKKEIADLAKENLGNITLIPNESNIFIWRATLPGPAGSPYEGGVFEVDIRIPENYPFAPPQLAFLTKVYHCNINSNGGICLDLLKNAWSPALSLYKVILSLSSLLTDPNPADPLVPTIAQELRRDKKKHDNTAREWVKLYAKPKVTQPTIQQHLTASAVSSRPRNPSRLSQSTTGSSSPAPPQIAGTRRTHSQANPPSTNNETNRVNGGSGTSSSRVIDIVDDSDEEGDLGGTSDIELLSGSSRQTSRANGRTNGTSGVKQTEIRRLKRARVDGGSGMGGDGDDVIVVDD